MPVEIKELLIRAVAAEEKSSTGPTEHGEVANKQAIVEECVRQVLKILRTLKER